jgi:hypothetical protein
MYYATERIYVGDYKQVRKTSQSSNEAGPDGPDSESLSRDAIVARGAE